MISFWTRARRFPPCLVRMLARWNYGRVMTDEEVAAGSGLLTPQLVAMLSSATSWHGIDLPTMQRFLIGCRMDFENAKQMHRIGEYLRRNPSWKHLKASPEWNNRWAPLIRKWHTIYGTGDTATIGAVSGLR